MKVFTTEWLNKETNHIRSTIGRIYVYANDEKIEGEIFTEYDQAGLLHIYGQWDNPDFNSRSLNILGVEVWDVDEVLMLYDKAEKSEKVQGMSFYYEIPVTISEKENG